MTRVHYLIRKAFGVNNKDISVIKSRQPSHIKSLAGKAVDSGAQMVVAVGGDGTVNTIARALVHSETALGVIPTGSGNGFARNIHVSLNVEEAINSLLDPVFRRIDVGEVNGGEHIFLVSCGFGMEALIASAFEDTKWRGIITYAGVTLKSFAQYEPQDVHIDSMSDGWSYSGQPLLFSVANMREYGVGITIAPNAKYNDGFLDICLIPKHNFLNAVKFAPEMFREQTATIPGYISRKTDSVHIKRSRHGNLHVDGTPYPAGDEVDIRVLPQALIIAKGK